VCNQQKLLEYIAIHDAPCPNCLANLRGHVEDVCPVCDCRLFLGSVRSFHLAFGDSKSEPVCRPKLSHRERVAEYLAKNDAPCPSCFRNLRGQPEPVCPACKEEVQFRALYFAHLKYGDSGARPMPVPGSAESQRLDIFLAKNSVGCPACGYELHGLVSETCPECGEELMLPSLMFERPRPVRMYHATINTLTTFTAAPIVIALLIVLLLLVGSFSASDAVYYGISATLLSAMLYAIVIPGRKMLRKSLGWAWLYNPVMSIIGVYCVGLLMAVMF